MSSIPYNYGKYIDDVTKMTQRGAISSGEQQASPSSAGSRGLAKTMQFTNNPTQMKMGNSPIAESMVEIRNILNRIDGVNAPVQEDEGEQALANDLALFFTKRSKELLQSMERPDKNDQEYEEFVDIAQAFKKGIQAGLDEVNMSDFEFSNNPFGDFGRGIDDGPDEELVDILNQHGYQPGPDGANDKATIVKQKEESVSEDDGDEIAIAAMKLAKDENRKEGFDYPQGGKYGYKAERGSGTGAMGTMQVNVTIHDRETDETMYIKDMNYLELEKGDEQETLAMIWDENRDLIQKESEVQEDAGEDEKVVDMLRNIKQHLDNHPNMSEHPSLVALDQLADDLESGDKPADYESTSEDSDELSRLKELSGIQEDAELTDEQEKGLEAIAKKYKDREGGNGDELARGHIKALTSSGITTDGFDVEEMEAYAKKIGKDWPEWEDEIDDFLKQAPITSGMMDDMNKVLGPDWEQNEKLSAAAADVLDKSAGFVPMPEADEFDIEEDEDFEEVLGPLGFPEDELWEAEYRGRKVPLNKPMRGDVKKFKVYVKDPKTGNVKKVNFGHGGTSAKRKTMRIRKSNPKARKSFRARHNCANPGPKTKARYWSCRKW